MYAHPILVLHGGGAFRARHFQYALEYSEPEEAGLQTVNIDYSSSLVPGFAIDGEVYPLARLLEGFGRGLGIGLTYERVFLETNQEVESNEGIKVEALETNHSHFKGRLFYKHTFGEGFGLHPQIWGGLSYGLLNFTVEDNAEYNGVEYSYFGQSLGGSIPFGTPAVGLDIDLGILQADIGDTVEELGGSVNTFGIRGYLGYVGYFLQRISLKFGMEYTRMNQTVAGRGRPYGDLEGEYGPEHGRTGETAEDQYISFRLMIGYIL